MVKDRTVEFRSTINTISSGNFTQFGSSVPNSTGNNQFLDRATNISQEFKKISTKLDQLSRRTREDYWYCFYFVVAKNKSIFDDKPEEFEELSNVIKRELSLLNRRIQELKSNWTTTQIGANKTVVEYQRNVILILQNWTAQSFKSFENILEIRSQNLKSKKDRKDQFGGSESGGTSNFLAPSFRASTPPATNFRSSPSPSASTAASNTNSPLKHRPIDPTFISSQVAPVTHIDSSGINKKFDDNLTSSHVAIDFSSQQQTLMMEQEPLLSGDSKNIRARNNALGAIESTINELGTIYQQLAHLVAEQGETVQRIDFNIEDMSVNVISGQNQLARYLRRVNSNRFLIAKMFLALIIFIVIFKFLFL